MQVRHKLMNLKRWFCFLSLAIITTAAFAKPTQVQGIRIWPSPESTRIVFDLSAPVQYKVQTLKHPHRLVVDFMQSDLSFSVSKVSLQQTPIQRIRTGRQQNHGLRVVFEVKQAFVPKSFTLKPNQQYGHRLVLDLESSEKEAILALFDVETLQHRSPGAPLREQAPPRPQDFIVAIDCGHGGEDPGAIGPRGTREKDVVLNIGHDLKNLINQQRGMRAFLIRTGDYYVGLRDRVARARQRDADLFVSIHADAFKSPKAQGASVFVLSDHGATSEAAKWLAEKENATDLIGGVRLANKGDVLASVLLDLSQTASTQSSLNAARHVLQSMGRTSPLHQHRVERAGFAVLKAPDMPSILVETGFISNPHTEQKLRTRDHQRKIAQAVFHGIKQYFSGKKKEIHHSHSSQTLRASFKRYKVVKGDSLSRIAVRHRVSMQAIKRENRLKNNQVQLGQILKIPIDS